jgi:hypothetical protein
MELDELRELALRLPGTVEKPHFALIGFRVADKGFIAVQPDGTKALVQVDDATAAAFIDEDPVAFGPLTRMGTPIGVEVALADVDSARMAALVEASWRHRAPRRLVKERDARA